MTKKPTPDINSEPIASNAIDSKLKEILVQAEILTADQLTMLERTSGNNQHVFEQLLLSEGYLTSNQLGQLMAQVHGWKYINLDNESVDQELLQSVSEEFAELHMVVPFRKRSDTTVSLATTNPGNGTVIRLLKKRFGEDCPVYYATSTEIKSTFSKFDSNYQDRSVAILESYKNAAKKNSLDDNSIVDFVDTILLHGIRSGASDIHIEPTVHDSVVRERIDGVLKREITFGKDVHDLVTLRIKVLANLATDEHSEPQDGKILYETPEGKRADIRVSIVPTTQGEKLVLRLLIAQNEALTLDSIGMMGVDLEYLQEALKRSWGLILVTGPTGAGKTTTLYSALRALNSDDVNIATIEDPAEYDLPGANQIQVNEKAGLTFANGLRSIVRQDPDIILVGEIRDAETAGIAVNSAMTGHLVLSTLHTNDAATAIPRLIDMGIEPFLISSTVDVIVAQRLVRKICPRCRHSKEVKVSELKDSIPKDMLSKLAKKKKTVRLFEGDGCKVCNNTGYRGRIGVFEVLRVDDHIHDLIMKNADADDIAKAGVKAGMNTMLDDGIEKVLQGYTTIEEVLRVLRS